jgi:hypothetical protein
MTLFCPLSLWVYNKRKTKEVCLMLFTLLRCVLSLQVRFEVLSSGKTLLTPQLCLRTGFTSALANYRHARKHRTDSVMHI